MEGRNPGFSWSRAQLIVTGTVLLIAVLLPLAPKATDGFPFSNYPMFTAPRDFVRISTLLALQNDQESLDKGEPVPPRDVANDEVMLAAMTIARAVAAGPESVARLCAEVAIRVVARDNPQNWQRIVVVQHSFAPMDYIKQGRLPQGSAKELYRCAVPSINSQSEGQEQPKAAPQKAPQ